MPNDLMLSLCAILTGASVLGGALLVGWHRYERHSERRRDGAFIPQKQIDALVSTLAERLDPGEVGASTSVGTPEALPYSMVHGRKRG